MLALIAVEWGVALANLVALGRRFRWSGAVVWTDFSAYWTAWSMVLHGQGARLYDRAAQESTQRALLAGTDIGGAICVFLYPPHFALVGLPVGWLAERAGEPIAFAVWSLVNLALLVRVALIVCDELRAPVRLRCLVFVWLLAFYPVIRAVTLGQISLLLAVAALELFRCARAGRNLAGAAWLAVFTIKPQLLPPLLIWLAGRRAWPLLARAGGICLFLGAVTSAVLGPRIWVDYATHVRGLESYYAAPLEMPNVRAALLRLLPGCAGCAEALAYACWLAALCGLAWDARRSAGRRDPRAAFALPVAAGLLFDPHLFHQDLALEVAPLALLLAALRDAGGPWRPLAALTVAWPVIYLLGRTADLTATPLAPFRTPVDPILVTTAAVMAVMVWSNRRIPGDAPG